MAYESCCRGRPDFASRAPWQVPYSKDFSSMEMQIRGFIAGRFTSVLSSTKILMNFDAHSPAT